MKKSLIATYVLFFALALWTATSTAQITFNPAATGSGGGTLPPSSFPLFAPLGTAAAPSYSFTGDPDTGIFSSAANTLNIASNGSSMVVISSLGAAVNGAFLSNSVQIPTSGAYAFANSVVIRQGIGTPEGVVTAPVGSLFLRNDGGAGTTLYVKQSGVGNTGWIPK